MTSSLDSRRVAVTAYGLVAAGTRAPAAILAAARRGVRFAAAPELDHGDLAAAAGLPDAEVRKMDRISLLALGVCRETLTMAKLADDAKQSCGIYVGNSFAGWTFAEDQLEVLYEHGCTAVSPYLASAWFPAAPQGHTSIALNLRGRSKTITTDRSAGLQAIGLAAQEVAARGGHTLAGGVEAPRTRFVTAAYRARSWPSDTLAEAAGFLLLGAGLQSPTGIFVGASMTRRADDASVDAIAEAASANEPTAPPSAIVVDTQPGLGLEDRFRRTFERRFPGAEYLSATGVVGDAVAGGSAVAAVLGCALLAERPSRKKVLVVSGGHQCVTTISLEARS